MSNEANIADWFNEETGKKVQRLKIHYNCIGAIEIPDLSKLPENNVSVHTRQGVNVQYAALAV